MATTTLSKSSTSSKPKKALAPRKVFKRSEIEALALKISRGRYPATAKDERARTRRLVSLLLNPES